jgi:hypothetical protein
MRSYPPNQSHGSRATFERSRRWRCDRRCRTISAVHRSPDRHRGSLDHDVVNETLQHRLPIPIGDDRMVPESSDVLDRAVKTVSRISCGKITVRWSDGGPTSCPPPCPSCRADKRCFSLLVMANRCVPFMCRLRQPGPSRRATSELSRSGESSRNPCGTRVSVGQATSGKLRTIHATKQLFGLRIKRSGVRITQGALSFPLSEGHFLTDRNRCLLCRLLGVSSGASRLPIEPLHGV